jgi:hypothetical protein
VPSCAAWREEAKAVRRLSIPHAHRTIAAARDDLNRRRSNTQRELVMRVPVRWCVCGGVCVVRSFHLQSRWQR